MRLGGKYLPGGVLPTVVVVSVVMLTALLGLLVLWEHEMLLFAHSCRLRQTRADVESAYTFYRMYPGAGELTAPEGYRLHDSLPQSHVFVKTNPWGLYEAVEICTADSLMRVCRLLGVQPDAGNTLYYADNRSAVTLAGQTVLQGTLHMPQNGLIYGRIGSDFYRGAEIPRTTIRQAEKSIRAATADVRIRIGELLAETELVDEGMLPDSLGHSFLADSALFIRVGSAEIGDCSLRGKIVLCADELRIDSTCRMEHLVVSARKITVGRGARITAQLFARDTVLVESRAVLEYPSGIYARQFVELGSRSEVNGYAIVCDTATRKKIAANYRQDRTARLRGLLYVDGVAQVQGIVAGSAVLKQAVYFSPQGYYKDMLYDVAVLENPVTAQPLWLDSKRRKEAVCVD
ncbi:polymer-forming cytoskeletal protein [uncultured Alistipes sp.]|jgi:hypothetical protein|uniref:polymer-forming cytoskeletal protein n=1 Tax=uncultured Alistipes sp. TaxID=538949 RepID=UPI0025E1F760|nr:polymer-forming cytoskeletal protein [uncultured Alistipes sp.]